MRKVFLFICIILCCSTPKIHAQTKSISTKIFFDKNDFELFPFEKSKIDELLDSTSLFKITKILIAGYTDSDADSAYNILLSKNRAEEVKNYLLLKEIDNQLIDYRYYGEKNPIAPNTNDFNKQKNRRVDIIISYKSKNKQVKLPALTERKITSSGTFERDTVIVFENGTIAKIPQGAFGNIARADVKINMNAIKDWEECVAAGITTTDIDGNLLETAGMFFVDMYKKDGKPICTIPNKMISVDIPADTIDPAMQMFDLVKTKNGTSVWKPSNQQFSSKIINGKKYYSTTITCSSRFNFDRCRPDRIPDSTKINKFDTMEIRTPYYSVNATYLSTNNTNQILNYKSKKKIVAFNETADNNPILTVIKRKNGKVLVYSKPLIKIHFRKSFFRHGYVIRKRDFTVLKSYKQLKPFLKNCPRF